MASARRLLRPFARLCGQGPRNRVTNRIEHTARQQNNDDKDKARLREIITKLNNRFEGDLTNDDQLVYISNVLKPSYLNPRRALSR